MGNCTLVSGLTVDLQGLGALACRGDEENLQGVLVHPVRSENTGFVEEHRHSTTYVKTGKGRREKVKERR
jgi:hypothetical protein